MLPKLPDPVENYLMAEKAKDADAIARCFAEDGVVHDDDEDHRGRDAIRRWKREADAKYTYALEPLSATVDRDIVIVRARLEGNFPGSPVELDHVFKIANDTIVSLEIG
jgi:hypothetical protein